MQCDIDENLFVTLRPIKDPTMKKNIIIFISIFFALISCSSVKNSSTTPNISSDLPTNITYSNNFKQFWSTYVSDINSAKSLQQYRPSKELISTNNLMKLDGKYFIFGMIYVDAATFSDKTSVGNIKFSTVASDLYKFYCPITDVVALFDIKGIVRIELSETAYTK